MRSGVGKMAGKRLFGIMACHAGQLRAPPALRPAEPHGMAGPRRKRAGEKFHILGLVRQQDFRWRVLVVIELAKKRRQHIGGGAVRIVAEEIGPVAVIRAAADEEGLDAGPLAASRHGDDVGILEVRHIDVLAGLDAAERADSVAPDRGCLEFQLVGGGMHALGIVPLDGCGFARQEAACLIQLRGVILAADKVDTRAAAPFDLILKAGAGARAENRIRAGPQHEGPRQVGHRAVDRAGRGEGAEIVSLSGLAATMFLQLAERVVGCQQNLRQALVVAKQDVVARLQPLDQVRFQKQRLDLGTGDDDLEGLGLAHHPHEPV